MPIPGSPEMNRIEPAPGADIGERRPGGRQLGLTADERCVDLLAGGRRRTLDHECGHLVGLALEGQGEPVAPGELAFGQPPSLGAGEHAAGLGR